MYLDIQYYSERGTFSSSSLLGSLIIDSIIFEDLCKSETVILAKNKPFIMKIKANTKVSLVIKLTEALEDMMFELLPDKEDKPSELLCCRSTAIARKAMIINCKIVKEVNIILLIL
jgi:hypothetical protein